MSLGLIRRLDAKRILCKDKPGLIAVIAMIAGIPFLLGGLALVVLLIRGFTNPESVEPDTLKLPVRFGVLLSAAGFMGSGILLTNTRRVIATKVRFFQKTITRKPFADFTRVAVAWWDISQYDGPANWYVAQVMLEGAKGNLALVRFDEWDRAIAAAADVSSLLGLSTRLDPWRPGDAPRLSHGG